MDITIGSVWLKNLKLKNKNKLKYYYCETSIIMFICPFVTLRLLNECTLGCKMFAQGKKTARNQVNHQNFAPPLLAKKL